jgi:predicted RNA-binding Zn-ribbon protein involved in translation (DUF1610 family)
VKLTLKTTLTKNLEIMAFAHPIVAAVLLFIIVFAIFFVLIFGLLQYRERRQTAGPASSYANSTSPPATGTNERIPLSAESTKFCISCGANIPTIADYCPNCGSQQLRAS